MCDYTTITRDIASLFKTAAAEANALDEARDVFRCAVAELCARAAALGIPAADREHARLAAEDVLTDLFYTRECALKDELGEE